jgi:hypothetical protein
LAHVETVLRLEFQQRNAVIENCFICEVAELFGFAFKVFHEEGAKAQKDWNRTGKISS